MPTSAPAAPPRPAPAPVPVPTAKPAGPFIPLGPVKLDPAKAPPRIPISELRAQRDPGAATAAPTTEQPAAPVEPAAPAPPAPTAPEQPLVQLAMEIFNAKIVDVRKKE